MLRKVCQVAGRVRRVSREYVRGHTTASFQKTLIDALEERNMVQAATSSAIKTHLATTQNGALVPRTVYAGVDPSAASMHVGNLLPLLALLHCALHGHTALVLVCF